jgi:hypothetical protein
VPRDIPFVIFGLETAVGDALQWNTIPTKLQRELFDTAGSMGDVLKSAARRRSRVAHMDDPALAEPYWCGPGGATGDHSALASCWLQSVLALEIPK